MYEIGRVCIKLKGKDAGKKCIIIDYIDRNHVFVDGLTRRKKSSKNHLKPTDMFVQINRGASHEEVMQHFNQAVDL